MVWIIENASVTVPASITGSEPRIIESMATFQSQVAEVDLSGERFVPCTLAFQEIDPFYPWMAMPPDAVGLLIWQVVGRKLRSATEVPKPLAERIAKEHGDFLETPQV